MHTDWHIINWTADLEDNDGGVKSLSEVTSVDTYGEAKVHLPVVKLSVP